VTPPSLVHCEYYLYCLQTSMNTDCLIQYVIGSQSPKASDQGTPRGLTKPGCDPDPVRDRRTKVACLGFVASTPT